MDTRTYTLCPESIAAEGSDFVAALNLRKLPLVEVVRNAHNATFYWSDGKKRKARMTISFHPEMWSFAAMSVEPQQAGILKSLVPPIAKAAIEVGVTEFRASVTNAAQPAFASVGFSVSEDGKAVGDPKELLKVVSTDKTETENPSKTSE